MLPVRFSPPFGEVTVIKVPRAIENKALLTSFVPVPSSQISILTSLELIEGTCHAYVPKDACTLFAIVNHVAPLSGVYPIPTKLILLLVHVMFCCVPAVQFSPPLGDVRVIDGLEVPVPIVK